MLSLRNIAIASACVTTPFALLLLIVAQLTTPKVQCLILDKDQVYHALYNPKLCQSAIEVLGQGDVIFLP